MKIIFEYPSWHDDARRLKAEGSTLSQIADKLGSTASRISQIATPNWKQFLIVQRRKDIGSIANIKNIEDYNFVPVKSLSPKDTEESRRKNPPKRVEHDVASKREFESKKSIADHGRFGITYMVRCNKCDTVAEHLSMKGPQPFEFVAQRFKNMGWIIGASPRADLCPTHAFGLRDNKPTMPPAEEIKPIVNDVSIPPAGEVKMPEAIQASVPEVAIVPTVFVDKVIEQLPIQTVPPQVPQHSMGKTERRIIFAKLNDVYIDENTGYSADWTDQKVADDLGVALAWVQEVRDADFGPEISAAMRAATHKTLMTIAENIERNIVLIDKKIELQQSLDKKISDAIEVVEGAIKRFDELRSNLDTADEQMKTHLDKFSTDAAAFKKMYDELRGSSSA